MKNRFVSTRKHKGEWREFARYVSLNVAGMIGLSCYILADTFFVAQGLGTDGLAALNLAIPVFNFITGCGLMLGMGSATRFSIARAQNDGDRANQIFTNALWAVCGTAACFMALGAFASRQITALLGADMAVFAMTDIYLKVILLFAPAYLLNNLLLAYVRNDGNPRLSMIAMVTGSLANIVLDYVFIFPMGLGMFGAVLATGFAPVISIAILSRHLFSGRCGFRPVRCSVEGTLVGSYVAIGFPSLVSEVSSGVVIILLNIIILDLLGNVGVASYSVIANIALVVIAIFTGIGQGIQPIVSQAYGAGDGRRAETYFRYGIMTAAAAGILLYGILYLFASPIVGLFNRENHVQMQQIAEEGMRIYFLYAPFAGFNIVAAMYFASIERAAAAQTVSLLRGLVLVIPLALILSRIWGMEGVWLTFPVTEILTVLAGIGFWKVDKGRRRNYHKGNR